MRKIRIKHDMYIPGWGKIYKGEEYKVDKFNQRFVYVTLSSGAILRLARKGDTETIY